MAPTTWCYVAVGLGVLALAASIVFNSFCMADWEKFSASKSPMEYSGNPGAANWWLFAGLAIAIAFIGNSRSKLLGVLMITVLYFWFDTLRNWHEEQKGAWYARRTLWAGIVGPSVALLSLAFVMFKTKGIGAICT